MISMSKLACLYDYTTLATDDKGVVSTIKDYIDKDRKIHDGYSTLIHSALESEIFLPNSIETVIINPMGGIFGISTTWKDAVDLVKIDLDAKKLRIIVSIRRDNIKKDINYFIAYCNKDNKPFIIDIFGNIKEFGKYSKYGVSTSMRNTWVNTLVSKLNNLEHIVIQDSRQNKIVGTLVNNHMVFTYGLNRKTELYRIAHETAESYNMECRIVTFESFISYFSMINPFKIKE